MIFVRCVTAFSLSLFFVSATFAAENFTIGFHSSGKIEINGAPYKKSQSAGSFLYSDVEKTIPSPGGGTILYLRPLEFRQPDPKQKNAVSATKVSGESKPFTHAPDWKMFDAEGQPTLDPALAFRVLMPSPIEGDGTVFDAKWNECEGTMTGNFTGYACSRNRFLSDEYAAYLSANILKCVNEGLARVGGGEATAVHLVHNGTAGDAAHSPRSLHTAGRAVDVQVMNVTVNHRQLRSFGFGRASLDANSRERSFYLGFRGCWHRKQEKRGCPRKESSGGTGTIGWEDRRHQHHLHVSMPFCPNTGGYFITKANAAVK